MREHWIKKNQYVCVVYQKLKEKILTKKNYSIEEKNLNGLVNTHNIEQNNNKRTNDEHNPDRLIMNYRTG